MGNQSVVSSESKAKEVLERLKKGILAVSQEKLVSAEFEQKVEINQKTVSTDKIVSPIRLCRYYRPARIHLLSMR